MLDHFVAALAERGYSFATPSEFETARDITEKLCFVSRDYDEDLRKADTSSDLEKNYELPDGQVITIGSERFRAPEILFTSETRRKDYNIKDLLFNSIGKCDHKMREGFLFEYYFSRWDYDVSWI